ncbi:hypothetical protein Q31b_09560 [Novipirellula aureliae]|uniref:Uncharacterized protein n=1 Tax=Novipirellula aureliae TaxID=2527966 RepID=A0A5C6EAM4_9BACT|nr:hypothetical protein Q31b_09560 [Novipirellula aureliae]
MIFVFALTHYIPESTNPMDAELIQRSKKIRERLVQLGDSL